MPERKSGNIKIFNANNKSSKGNTEIPTCSRSDKDKDIGNINDSFKSNKLTFMLEQQKINRYKASNNLLFINVSSLQ